MSRVRTVVLLALVAVLGLGTPALAEVRVFFDAAGDTGSRSDITRVRVDHGGRIQVTAQVGLLRPGDRYDLFLDTRRADIGPEYRMTAVAHSDTIILARVDTWWGPGRTLNCPDLTARTRVDTDTVSFGIPRACVGLPQVIRTALRAKFGFGSDAVFDWAPAVKRFFGPVTFTRG